MKNNFHKILFIATIFIFVVILVQTIWHPIKFNPLKGVTVKTEMPKLTFETYKNNSFQKQFDKYFEVWLSLVEHYVRDVGAASSNLVTSTSRVPRHAIRVLRHFFFIIPISR